MMFTRRGGVPARRRALPHEQALKRSIAKVAASANARSASDLALVFRHANIGLGLYDRDLRFLHVNEPLAEMNGLSSEAHLGRTIREVLPKIADDVEALLRPVLDHGDIVEDVEISGETLAQPGVWRTWRASYYPNFDDHGAIVGLLAVIREITDERRAKAVLAETESRLAMAMDGSDLGVWDWSVENNTVWFSDTWQTMLGYEPGEVEPHVSSWQKAVHPDDWPIINAALDPHLAGLTPHYECEHRVRCKDGSWLWILDRGKVVKRAEDGRALRMVGTHDNIQGRKEGELHRAALLELGRDLAELDNVNRVIDRSLMAILDMLDVDFAGYTETGPGPGYPRMARRWRDGRSGFAHGQWVGIRSHKDIARSLIRGETVMVEDLHSQPYSEVVDMGEPEAEELRALLAVPVIRHDWLVGTVIAAHRVPRKWSAREAEFLSDIRDRMREAIARAKAGEANRQAQEELQRIGRLNALSALTSTLAHELNQPLAAATNYLMVARLQAKKAAEGAADAAADRPLEAIELAAAQVTKAGDIIRQMRAFTHSGEVAARPASVSKAIDDAVETTLASMAPRALILRKSYAPDLPLVLLDTVQFQQVISNLVRNAIEAMDSVEKPELDIMAAQTGETVTVTVADNGPGLSPDVLETLFQPFRSGKRRGLGLGLPICRTIIEAHGGKLTGEQRAEGGALFRIVLPIAPPIDGD